MKLLIFLSLIFYLPSCTQHEKKISLNQHLTQQEKNHELSEALLDENLKATLYWLQQGADVNSYILWNYHTPLTLAIMKLDHSDFHKKLFDVLIHDKNIDINQPTSSGKAPIMFAAEYELFDIVRLFLDRGATVDIIDKDGNSLLSFMYFHYYRLLQSTQQCADNGGCIGAGPFKIYEELIPEILKRLTASLSTKQDKEKYIKELLSQIALNYIKPLELFIERRGI